MIDYEKEAREVAERLGRVVNRLSFDISREPEFVAFVDQIVNREHRTLQQGIMRLFMGVLEAWAQKARDGEGNYDLRNEATVKLARQIMDNLPEEGRYLPLI